MCAPPFGRRVEKIQFTASSDIAFNLFNGRPRADERFALSRTTAVVIKSIKSFQLANTASTFYRKNATRNARSVDHHRIFSLTKRVTTAHSFSFCFKKFTTNDFVYDCSIEIERRYWTHNNERARWKKEVETDLSMMKFVNTDRVTGGIETLYTLKWIMTSQRVVIEIFLDHVNHNVKLPAFDSTCWLLANQKRV